MLEIYTAMICACLMAIRPLITKYLPRLFPTTSPGSGPGHSHSNAYNFDPKSAAAPWSRNQGSEIELKNTESAQAWTDAESSHDDGHERNRDTRGLEVWRTRSLEQAEIA